MPQEMALCSVACAIQNLWLAARVENLGMGWVSMFDPAALASLLQLPDTAQPVAVLCLGPVPDFYEAPMLELEDWRHGRSFYTRRYPGYAYLNDFHEQWLPLLVLPPLALGSAAGAAVALLHLLLFRTGLDALVGSRRGGGTA